jgi:DNA-binding transcriptional LysR family regulator
LVRILEIRLFKNLSFATAMPDRVQRFKQYNLTQLRVFCEFIQQKSFTATAQAMHLSLSGVWQQVRALERRLGVSLLQRHGRTWRPTEDGQALFDLISDLIRSVDSLDDTFRRLRGELSRELRVIATPGSAAGELVGPLVELKRKHPSIRVQLSMVTSPEQTAMELLSGDADLAVVPSSIIGRLRRPSLEMITLRQRPAGLLVHSRHRLARRPQFTLADLVSYPLIMPLPDILWRQLCDEVFRVAGLFDRVQISMEVNVIQAIEEFARRKVGVGLIPLVAEWKPGPGVVKLPAEHFFPPEHLFLIRRRGKPRPQAQILEELLLKQAPTARPPSG